MGRPTYIDIDGTLTDDGKAGGRPKWSRINRVRQMIAEGKDVVIWSGSGTKYAEEFCRHHQIFPLAALGKPDIAVDDNPNIRPVELIRIQSPDEFFGSG